MHSSKITIPLAYGGKKQRFARCVIAGDFVFLSGASGRTMDTGEVSSNDAAAQTRVALDKIKAALEAAGSAMENIVKVVILFKDMQDYEAVKTAEFAYYERHAPALAAEPPASTVCQVVSLSKPDMLVEFDIVALKG